jgi:hypothetical protein
MSEKAPIFIATSSHDEATVSPVVRELECSGYPTLIYEADRVALGEIPLSIAVSNKEGLTVTYNDKPLDLLHLGAAWLRRPSTFGVQKPGEDRATRMSIDRERRAAQAILWDTIPDERWLNTPRATMDAQEKIGQLLIARELGFTIPDTMVSNNWPAIVSMLPKGDLAFKTFGGLLHSADGSKAAFTRHFASQDDLPLSAQPFPGIMQQFIGKQREWRVTVVGDEIFPAAIYTDAEAKHDWRQHQGTASVRFQSEPFPEPMQQRCKAFLAHTNLRYGAFDFVENDAGIFFIEMNPAGQYGWLEEELGLPISRSIADELICIANRAV